MKNTFVYLKIKTLIFYVITFVKIINLNVHHALTIFYHCLLKANSEVQTILNHCDACTLYIHQLNNLKNFPKADFRSYTVYSILYSKLK